MGRLAQDTTVMLQGQPHRLLLDMNGMVAFEEATGENFFTYSERAQADGYRPSSKELRALLWAELLHYEPTLTLQDVGALITAADLVPICAAVMTAQNQAAPLPDEEEQPDPNPSSPSIG